MCYTFYDSNEKRPNINESVISYLNVSLVVCTMIMLSDDICEN
jgi:hypothetical protein